MGKVESPVNIKLSNRAKQSEQPDRQLLTLTAFLEMDYCICKEASCKGRQPMPTCGLLAKKLSGRLI